MGESSWLKESLQYILGMKHPPTVEVGGRPYRTVDLTPVPEPTVDTLGLTTLSGLVEYIALNRDVLNLASAVIHVVSPSVVEVLLGASGAFLRRGYPVKAAASWGARFPVDTYLDQESFITSAQCCFVADEALAHVLRIVGTLADGIVTTLADNGITQTVKSKTGIAKLELVGLPSPLMLRPYRTFGDIEQPEVQYILRARSGAKDGELPTMALFEVKDPTWTHRAMLAVAEHLRSKLAGSVPVIV